MISMKKNIPVIFIISLIIAFFVSYPIYSEETSHSSPEAADTHVAETPADTESHGEGHSADRGGDLIDLLYRFMSFAAMIIILVIVFRKTKILDYFSTRSEEIKKKLDDLKRDKDEAERKFKEVEEQLKNFEAKRKDIIEQYRQEGMNEKDRIISEAKERVKQIIIQSEITIEQEIESARNQLKQDIIDIASQKAQDILVKELNEKDQENMVVEFVEKVGKVN
ncbi:MAG: ATP synthase F0 subunit B [Desulfobacteraceae bacterium]|jgi:F-type H+-transporting ATPase subunit b